MRLPDRHHPALYSILLGLLVTAQAAGHEIPSDVTVRMIVRAESDRIDMLVRAPLEAMQDIEFPSTDDGYLDIGRADAALRNAVLRWLAADISISADGEALGPPALETVRATIPSDRSFESFETAAAHLRGPPIAAGTPLVWQQALIDAWLSWPRPAGEAALSVTPDLDRLGLAVTVAMRFETTVASARVFQLRLTGDEPQTVPLEPRWHTAALSFLEQGIEHILGGVDHLLFLLCLVLPLRTRLGALIVVVTAFTVAHSITLLGSAFGIAPGGLWFPPLVETLIAVSILYMAVENVLFEQVRMRWLVAFGFGLVHGFGFSFALRETLQFAGDHLPLSLLAFNVGVEIGQLAVLVVLVPVLNFLFRFVPVRAGVIVISVLVGHTAWHWMAERYAELRAYPAFGAVLSDATVRQPGTTARLPSTRNQAGYIDESNVSTTLTGTAGLMLGRPATSRSASTPSARST